MKRFLILLSASWLGAGAALAQQPSEPAAPAAAPAAIQVAPPKCEPKPEWPGRLASNHRQRLFNNELKAYKDCMNTYLDEQKARMKAHQEAANAAITEHNEVMQKISDAQKASQ